MLLKQTRCLLLVSAVSLALTTESISASDYAKDLAAAVDKHENGAPNAKLELEIVDELRKLSAANEAAWLPDFWAAYLLTQVTMSHSENVAERLKSAQQHLDRAKERSEKDPTAPVADLHAMQSLIHSFKLGGIKEKEEWERVKASVGSELDLAYRLDPESPIVMVHAGTDLIEAGNQEKDWAKVMGGLALLRQADAVFENAKQPRGLGTHYNSEWIKPWANWVYRLYAEGFDAQ